MKFKFSKIVASCAVLGALGFMSNAMALGTTAGSSISNQATLAFSVGGVGQTAVQSNTVSFVVDNKAIVTVTHDNNTAGAPTVVTPGGTGFVQRFRVTNTGNGPQDYALTVTSAGFNGQTVLARVDNFDVTGCAVYSDLVANTGTYNAGTMTATYIDELPADGFRYVYAVCNVPSTQVNNDFSAISVKATTAIGGGPGAQGGVLAQTAGANTAGVDVVFADAAGTDDAARDGASSARGGYLVQAATLTIVKNNTPICDPSNFTTNPKNIPLGIVRYSIAITNAAGAGSSATLGNLTDPLNVAGLTFDPNLVVPSATVCSSTTGTPESAAGRGFKITCTGGTRACTATPIYRTSAADADGFDFTSPNITAGLGVALPVEAGYTAGELKAGETVTVEFNATIN